MRNIEEYEKIIQAAVNNQIKIILDLIQKDPHSFGTRPCKTCQTISNITNKDFGCVKIAKQKANKNVKS